MTACLHILMLASSLLLFFFFFYMSALKSSQVTLTTLSPQCVLLNLQSYLNGKMNKVQIQITPFPLDYGFIEDDSSPQVRSYRKACPVRHLPPMMAEFLLTPFLIAWPCPGLYGKSALAVEEEMKRHIYHLSQIIWYLVFHTTLQQPVFPNEISISSKPILLLFPRRITATSVSAVCLCTSPRWTAYLFGRSINQS